MIFHAKEQATVIPDNLGPDGQGTPITTPEMVEALVPFGWINGYGVALVIDDQYVQSAGPGFEQVYVPGEPEF